MAVGRCGAKANSCDASWENLEPTAARIDQRPQGIMEITSDAISTNVDHQKERHEDKAGTIENTTKKTTTVLNRETLEKASTEARL